MVGPQRTDAQSAQSDGASPASTADALLGVPNISVETIVGTLPRLPRTVPGEYRGGAKGPAVRIIWPSPTNNQSVLQPGTFTVTGRVAGTKLEPKATVTVKAAPVESPAPVRSVEAFPLDRVTLNPDEQQRATPFIQHRDKFIQGLAQTDPDRFPLHVPRRLRTEAAGERPTPRRLGLPNDPAARTCERTLPLRHRPGLREHRLRSGPADQFPAEDELPHRHPVRPVAEVRSAGPGRRPLQRGSDHGAAGTGPGRTTIPT